MSEASIQALQPTVRRLTVLAQDPDIQVNGKPLLTKVTVPRERLMSGPRGSRFVVIDYDATTDTFYRPFELPDDRDPYDRAGEMNVDQLLADPGFHAQNVYAIAASTLFEFERALGRQIGWGFDYGSHRIKLFPHAFCEANAFYSRADESLAFGYFPHPRNSRRTVFTCLSHDVIAHETTHALLDGLRGELMRPSSPDQAAFHEAFADIVALLMVLKNEELVAVAVDNELPRTRTNAVKIDDALEAIRKGSFLNGLAEELGKALFGMGRDALRQSTKLAPGPGHYKDPRRTEPHDRGEVLVAAVMLALHKLWEKRLAGKTDRTRSPYVAVWRVAEEGAKAADHLLNMLIRAIDYLPPVHVDFGDFLSAALTADWQIMPRDDRYDYRKLLRDAFDAYGIKPAYDAPGEPGTWGRGTRDDRELDYTGIAFDGLRGSVDGVFELIWQNREALYIHPDVFTRVRSVRPVWRVGPDGFVLRETVAEYYQLLKCASTSDFRALKIRVPEFVDDGIRPDLVGGGTLVFDEYGRLKFHVHNRIHSCHQHDRLMSIWQHGGALQKGEGAQGFAEVHRRRGSGDAVFRRDVWT